MSRRQKEYEELTFTDDFMFCKVLENNNELSKDMLELILKRKIRKVSDPAVQQGIKVSYKSKGIRLDVYLEDDENTVFDIEMQTILDGNIPKRSRYYQSMIDLHLLEKGADYSELRKSYVIFICMQNPFKEENLHLYTFENRCGENTELLLGDETAKVFLTPDGTAEDVSDEMADFLNYLAGKGGSSSLVKRLEEAVCEAKSKEDWRTQYMTILMGEREKYAEGRAEGRTEGRTEERIAAVQKLIHANCTKEFIFSLGYTEEEYAEATKEILTTV